ncbi:unnamed protein product [Onchocerca ochengi]|uniref:WH1 domain-containing protein n=1 Tax=Onchocerca ochengi TaxID=42157 RepID=A0A182EFN2_ONCOC|nr:unnamed protein product [Onchocerca ochengi]
MEPSNWIESTMPLLNDRFRHITCVNVQIYKLEGNNWREMTKDFVLLHMYYDQEDREAKLIAIDGIKAYFYPLTVLRLFYECHYYMFLCKHHLIVRGFVLSSNLKLIRPTKKFVHFIGSKQRRSEMYGFGFYQVCEVEQFLQLFSFVYRTLHVSSRTVVQNESGLNRRHQSISSTKSRSPCPLSSPKTNIPKKDTKAIPVFSPTDSSRSEQVSRTDIDVDVQQIEKGLQGVSFISDASVTTSSLLVVPSLSMQTSGDAKSNVHCVNSAAFDANLKIAQSAEHKQYQLWSVPPWNALLEQGAYNNPANFNSPWNSLFNW